MFFTSLLRDASYLLPHALRLLYACVQLHPLRDWSSGNGDLLLLVRRFIFRFDR